MNYKKELYAKLDNVVDSNACEYAHDGMTCADSFNCCDCGGHDCGCSYCWSCNACENCK